MLVYYTNVTFVEHTRFTKYKHKQLFLSTTRGQDLICNVIR